MDHTKKTNTNKFRSFSNSKSKLSYTLITNFNKTCRFCRNLQNIYNCSIFLEKTLNVHVHQCSLPLKIKDGVPTVSVGITMRKRVRAPLVALLKRDS